MLLNPLDKCLSSSAAFRNWGRRRQIIPSSLNRQFRYKEELAGIQFILDQIIPQRDALTIDDGLYTVVGIWNNETVLHRTILQSGKLMPFFPSSTS